MAYSEELAERVRDVLMRDGISERKMFGGLAFMLNGNMCCGVLGEELMVRVGTDGYDLALARPHAREMDFTGRPMRGMVMVSPEGTAEDEEMADWVETAFEFATSLPPK